MPKKILFLNTTYQGGGAAKIARSLYDFMAEQAGWESHFAYGRGQAPADPYLFKVTQTGEVILDAMLTYGSGREGLGNIWSTRRLMRHIVQQQYDIIHLHNLHGYYLNFRQLLPFLGQLGRPVVWTTHDEWPLTWLPGYSLDCPHCLTGVGKCQNFYNYPKTINRLFSKFWLEQKQQVLSEQWQPNIVSPAQWLADKVGQSHLHKHSLEVISNGVNLSNFTPADKNQLRLKHRLPLVRKIILFSATDLKNRIKGLHFIVEVAAKLPEYLFLGIGAGNIAGANILCVGCISNEQTMAEYYALADLYCCPSLAEICPLSVLESLACGLPVVGFSIPALVEILAEYAPFLTPTGQAVALAQQITKLLCNATELTTYSRWARQIAVNKYDIASCYQKYFSLYNELVT